MVQIPVTAVCLCLAPSLECATGPIAHLRVDADLASRGDVHLVHAKRIRPHDLRLQHPLDELAHLHLVRALTAVATALILVAILLDLHRCEGMHKTGIGSRLSVA